MAEEGLTVCEVSPRLTGVRGGIVPANCIFMSVLVYVAAKFLMDIYQRTIRSPKAFLWQALLALRGL